MSMAIGIGIGIPFPRREGVGVAYDPNAVGRAALTAKLTANAADVSFGVLGTSIGNASTEWVRLLDPYYAAFASNYLVRNQLYYDAGSVYASPLLGQGENARITGATLGTSRFADTFNRADGVIGTSSGGQSYGTVTSYSISSNKVIQTSFSNQINPASGMPNDKHVTEIDFNFGNNAGDGMRLYELFTSTSACVYLGIAITGVVSLVYQPGVVTFLSVDTGADFVNGDSIHVKLVVDGNLLQGEVTRGGTTSVITALLSSAQKTALTGTKFAAGMTINSSGSTFDNLSVADIAQTRRLNVWNASIPGSTCNSQTSKVATTIGTSIVGTLDLLLIEPMSHNAGTDSPATFLTDLGGLVTAARAQQANVPIVLLKENPQASPSTTIAEHAARIAALDAFAQSNGFGLIDGFNGYNTANILSDALGVHPDATGSAYLALKVAQSFGLTA